MSNFYIRDNSTLPYIRMYNSDDQNSDKILDLQTRYFQTNFKNKVNSNTNSTTNSSSTTNEVVKTN